VLRRWWGERASDVWNTPICRLAARVKTAREAGVSAGGVAQDTE
jgi:hypothetical protein